MYAFICGQVELSQRPSIVTAKIDQTYSAVVKANIVYIVLTTRVLGVHFGAIIGEETQVHCL